MPISPAENEGFRLLDEFVCQAVPDPSLRASESSCPIASRGENEGLRVSDDAASGSPAVSSRPSPTSRAGSGRGRQPIAHRSQRSGNLTSSELRSLSTAELVALVEVLPHRLEHPPWELILEIVQERLARCREEMTLANELIATCQQRATDSANDA